MRVLRRTATMLGLAYVLGTRFGVTNLNFNAMQRIVYYEKLGLVYNRIKKNANTSMVILLRELETGAHEERKNAKRNSRALIDLPLSEVGKLRQASFFIVIRDPYTRVLSAFLDKFRFEKFTGGFKEYPLTPEGFRDFVHWLRDGGLNKNAHWDLQTKLMALPLSAYDRVIRFETLKADMVSYLEERQIQPKGEILESRYSSDSHKKTEASDRAEAFYTPEVRAIVTELYRKDFDALGYDIID